MDRSDFCFTKAVHKATPHLPMRLNTMKMMIVIQGNHRILGAGLVCILAQEKLSTKMPLLLSICVCTCALMPCGNDNLN